MNLPNLLKIAERTALKSTIRVKVAAILIDRRNGKVVATGYNHLSGYGLNGRHSQHAEVDALMKVRKPSSNLIMVLYRSGNKPIHPCAGCSAWIRSYGISKVVLMHEVKG